MNVFSVFDGMSTGQIALNKAGIVYDKYYASEINKDCIKVTQAHFPKTIQLGDISNIKGSDLPQIDLFIGGSPCQSFSPAISTNTGFDGKSKLFFEYVRLLKECKPKYFLLENVQMKKEWEDIITSHIGINPVLINSDLFSAQSRPRLYWTNIPLGKLPESNPLILNDILEHIKYFDEAYEKYFYKEPFTFYGYDKVVCATLHINGHDILKRVNSPYKKCQTLTAVCGGNQQKKVYESRFPRVRKLTPLEYERLQTIPENYTACVSDSARYKMLGNGWTADLIAYIFDGLDGGDVFTS
jgi:DNA (cytosine-5)-methyltransferase 3A